MKLIAAPACARIRLDEGRFVIRTRPVRARDRDHRPFFERDWQDFLIGTIFEPAG